LWEKRRERGGDRQKKKKKQKTPVGPGPSFFEKKKEKNLEPKDVAPRSASPIEPRIVKGQKKGGEGNERPRPFDKKGIEAEPKKHLLGRRPLREAKR